MDVTFRTVIACSKAIDRGNPRWACTFGGKPVELADHALFQMTWYDNAETRPNQSSTSMPFQRSSSRKLPFPRWYERILAMIILVNFCLIIFDITYLPLRDFWLQGRVQFTVKVGPFEQEFPKPPLRILPFSIAPYYDWVKGIEGNRTTDAYLRLVDQLNTRIDEKALEGYADPAKPVEPSSQNEANEVREGLPDFAQLGDKNAELNPKQPILEDENAEIPDILADLREASREMIVQNPFQIANKTGMLERIKNKMRMHVFDDQREQL